MHHKHRDVIVNPQHHPLIQAFGSILSCETNSGTEEPVCKAVHVSAYEELHIKNNLQTVQNAIFSHLCACNREKHHSENDIWSTEKTISGVLKKRYLEY